MFVLFVAAVSIGKLFQLAAVDQLGERLGFDLASTIGLAPFIVVLLILQSRYPRLRWRRR